MILIIINQLNMIIRKIRFLTKIQIKIDASYIKQADMDLIRYKYQQKGFMNRLKQMAELVKLIGKQGAIDGKNDVMKFKQLRKINYEERTVEQQKQYVEIHSNLKKIIPILIIWALPMSAPLFFVHLELFPTYVPSWVLTESVYQRLSDLDKSCRVQGKNYFTIKFNQTKSQVLAKKITQLLMEGQSDSELNDLSNQELRMISNLLLGRYSDGTFYYTKLSPIRKKQKQYDYFLSQKFSAFLLKRTMVKYVNNDTIHREEYTKRTTFSQRLEFQLLQSLKKMEYKVQTNNTNSQIL